MDGDPVDICGCRPRRGRYQEMTGFPMRENSSAMAAMTPRLAGAAFGTDGLAELMGQVKREMVS